MSDWIGLIFIVALVCVGLFSLSRLGKPPKPITPEEFERRVKEGPGAMSTGVGAGLHALQKLMNPKAAEAIEIQKDLRAGYYDDQDESGDDNDNSK
ncbi:MAG TPA: hypothetical protein VF666_05260 [Pyrinomonadaceae bacterium]|jgi:hypothetical protein